MFLRNEQIGNVDDPGSEGAPPEGTPDNSFNLSPSFEELPSIGSKEDEPGELEEDNAEPPERDNLDDLPEKLRGKTAPELAEMYVNLEKTLGKYSSAEEDLEIVRRLKEAGTKDGRVFTALENILMGKTEELLPSPVKEDAPGDDEDDYYLTEEQKELKELRAKVQELEKNLTENDDIKFARQAREEQERQRVASRIADEYSKMFGVRITGKELPEHFKKFSSKFNFRSLEQVAAHLARTKLMEAEGLSGGGKKPRPPAPNVKGGTPRSHKPGAEEPYKSFDDFKARVTAALKAQKSK